MRLASVQQVGWMAARAGDACNALRPCAAAERARARAQWRPLEGPRGIGEPFKYYWWDGYPWLELNE